MPSKNKNRNRNKSKSNKVTTSAVNKFMKQYKNKNLLKTSKVNKNKYNKEIELKLKKLEFQLNFETITINELKKMTEQLILNREQQRNNEITMEQLQNSSRKKLKERIKIVKKRSNNNISKIKKQFKKNTGQNF
jgi:hypothetical protein